MDNTKNIGIITAERQNGIDYLSKTILSLLTNAGHTGKIHVFNGVRQTDYLNHLHKNPKIIIHQIPESINLESMNQWERCVANYYEAMKYFVELEESAYLFEDDVVFTNNFFSKVFSARYEIEKETEDYALSLYTPINMHLPYGKDIGVALTPKSHYFGCQATYVPAKTLSDFIKGYYETPAAKRGEGIDMIIKEYFDERNNLFFTTPSLCQHIGRISSGTYGPGHYSQNFTF